MTIKVVTKYLADILQLTMFNQVTRVNSTINLINFLLTRLVFLLFFAFFLLLVFHCKTTIF